MREDNRNRYHVNRDRYARKNRDSLVRRTFGITLDELEQRRLEAQGCAICGSEDVSHADHKHGYPNLRGFLCQKCNMGLGMFDDDADRLRKAADYVSSH